MGLEELQHAHELAENEGFVAAFDGLLEEFLVDGKLAG
jgi:hypothetical protein